MPKPKNIQNIMTNLKSKGHDNYYPVKKYLCMYVIHYQVRIHQLIGICANVVRYANLHIARYSKVQI